jgi:hypothetical protein
VDERPGKEAGSVDEEVVKNSDAKTLVSKIAKKGVKRRTCLDKGD